MFRARSLSAFALIFVLLLATGCLEIVGQRLTLRHDADRDELQLMIQYDGIHDSGNNEHGNGAKQVAQAIADGEIMLVDWPFRLSMAELKKRAQAQAQDDVEMPRAVVDFIKLAAKSMSVQTLGYHRDPDGRIGGTQIVTIENAQAMIKHANAAISASMLANPGGGVPELPRSSQLMLAAAKTNHAWISLDGHALVIRVPIHAREWAAFKAAGILTIIKDLTSGQQIDDAERSVLKTLVALPVAYSDTDGMLTVRIGNAKDPTTFRFKGNKNYQPNLVEPIVEKAPRDVDDVMLKMHLGDKVQPQHQIVEQILKWGPPEEQVRSLIKVIKADDAKVAGRAIQKLDAFAEKWNETQAIPAAPRVMADTEEYASAWHKWYVEMLEFPLVLDGQPEVED